MVYRFRSTGFRQLNAVQDYIIAKTITSARSLVTGDYREISDGLALLQGSNKPLDNADVGFDLSGILK